MAPGPLWYLVIITGLVISLRPKAAGPTYDDPYGDFFDNYPIPPDIEEDDDGEDSYVVLKDLSDYYNPDHGHVKAMIEEMRSAQKATLEAANAWTNRSHTALKGVIAGIMSATHDTQNVLMTDGMRVKDAILKNFEENMNIIDAYSLDESARNRIIHDSGLSVILPPSNLAENGMTSEFNGRRIQIKSSYIGEYELDLRLKYARILNYQRDKDAFQVELEEELQGDDVPPGYRPILRHVDFDFVSEPSHQVKPHAKKADADAHKMAMYWEKPWVLVDHIPMEGEPGSPEPKVRSRGDWLNSVCKIVGWDDVHKAYRVLHPLNPEDKKNYETREYSDDEELYLLPGRDFHEFHDITGQSVRVTHFDNTGANNGSAYYGKAKVLKFDPKTVKYTVKIPTQELELTPNEITRFQREHDFHTKFAWTERAQADKELNDKLRSFDLPVARWRHKVSDEQTVVLQRWKHQNLETMAIDDLPLVYKFSETGRGSWTSAFKAYTDEQHKRSDLLKEISLTSYGKEAFTKIGSLPEKSENGAVQECDIATILHYLPDNNLNLMVWLGFDPLIVTKQTNLTTEVQRLEANCKSTPSSQSKQIQDWMWTERGANVMNKFIKTAKSVASKDAGKPGAFTDADMKVFEEIPGLAAVDWDEAWADSPALIEGPPQGFQIAARRLEEGQEEFIDAGTFMKKEKGGKIGPLVVVKCNGQPWGLGYITAKERKREGNIVQSGDRLRDYTYTIRFVALPRKTDDTLTNDTFDPVNIPEGDECVCEGLCQYKENWFNPAGVYRPRVSGDDVDPEAQRAQKFCTEVNLGNDPQLSNSTQLSTKMYCSVIK